MKISETNHLCKGGKYFLEIKANETELLDLYALLRSALESEKGSQVSTQIGKMCVVIAKEK